MTKPIAKQRILFFDFVRIFAILLVIFTHIAQTVHSPLGGFFGIKGFYEVSLGGVAVTLFLFLSGLVLEINYGRKPLNYFPFIRKRLTYIYPIYWLSTLIGIAIATSVLGPSVLKQLLNPFTVFETVTGFFPFFGHWSGPFVGSSWFIGLIVAMYLLYPFLSACHKKSPILTLLFTLFISVICRYLLGSSTILPNRPLDWFPLCRVLEFYLGIYFANLVTQISLFNVFNNFKYQKIVNFFSELSFPAFLIHFPLLDIFRVLIQKFPFTISAFIYLLLTIITSYVVLLTTRHTNRLSISRLLRATFMKKLVQLATNIYSDSLHRNSFFLMASTGVMALVGFIFWIIASRIYTQEAIGIGGSFVSLTNLIEGIASLGLPITLIRFLPTSKHPNLKISTAITLTGITSLAVSIGFFICAKYWLKDIFPLINNPFMWLIFMTCVVLGTWQQIGSSIFIAYNRAHWVFIESIVYSVFKVVLVVPFAFLNAFGIFIGQAGSLAIAALWSISVHILKFKVNFFAGLNPQILEQLGKYSAVSYVIGLTNGIPAQVLPAVVAASLGAESAAHFFLALMMVNLITIIPQASSQTLFAAASARPQLMRDLTIKSLKFQVILILIALTGLWIFGGWVLYLFGPNYSADTTPVLRILSLSVIPILIATPLNTRLRVRKQLKKLAVITFLGSITVIGLCFLGGRYGLNGVAYGYVFGQCIVAFLIFSEWKLQQSKRL